MSAPETLPIESIRPQVEQALRASRSLIISAPTGSGKSTRLPCWLAQEPQRRVLVVEPRRMACRALADHLSAQEGQAVGQRFGYSVRFEERRSAATQVLFVTPGVALRLLARDQPFDFHAVLLDEFHERSWEMDLVATLLRRRLDDDSEADLRLLITSATLEAEALAARLGAQHLTASGRAFPVTVRHEPGGVFAPSHERLAERVAQAVRHIVEREALQGELLVFLPGKAEIQHAHAALTGLAQARGLTLMPVHASLPLHELARAWAPAAPGQRRVFLATNVAETSLTLPGVTWVIDSGLERMMIHRGGKTALALVPTSQASMDQRLGRAGRVAPGQGVRLWDEGFRPEAATSPEIERMELDDLLLRAALCGLDGPEVEAAPWPSPPPTFALERARARVARAGALDAQGRLTPLGARLAQLPVSVEQARQLLDTPAPLRRSLPDLIALLERGQRLLLPLDRVPNPEATLEARRALFAGCRHEVAQALRALRAGESRRHGLHEAALREARQLAWALRRLIDPQAPEPQAEDDSPLDEEALIQHLLKRTPEAAFVLRERALKRAPREEDRARSEPWANGELEVLVEPYVAYREEDRPKRPADRPVAGLLLNITWLGERSGLGVLARGDMLLPCSLKTLAQAGLGQEVVHEVTLERRAGAWRVMGQVSRELAGVTLQSELSELSGDALRQAAAALILHNRLIKGVVDPLLDRLHLWQLLHQWPARDPETSHWRLDALLEQPAPEPLPYLIERLAQMEVQTCEELSLLEAHDLLPDLAGLIGAMPYELDALLAELPRRWELHGASYTLQIALRAGRVIMEPENHVARKNKEPAANLLPRLRGLRVIYQQASRSFTLRG